MAHFTAFAAAAFAVLAAAAPAAPAAPATITAAPFSAPSAPPAVVWARGYSNGACEAHPHAGVQTSDGGWLMVGDSVCYGGGVPFNRAIFVVKADAAGNEQWHAQLGDIGWNYGKFGVELDDGTFLVAGVLSVVDKAAQANGFPYIEARALFRLAKNGTTLNTTTLPNSQKLTGRRDGFMCATPVVAPAGGAGDALEVVATGYVGGNSGFDPATKTYDDAPMFLIQGGTATLVRLAYSRARPTAPPRVLSEQALVDPKGAHVFYQGMRVFSDPANGAIAVSAASQFSASNYSTQWGLVVLDAAAPRAPDGALPVRFANLYPASNARHPGPLAGGVMSHPYAFALAPGGGGYVLAGLAVLQPPGGAPARCEGRLALVAPNGTLAWDARFRADTDATAPDENTECYGVAPMRGGGYAVACGAGVEPELHPHDSPRAKTWRAFVHRADADGNALWQTCYTNNTGSQVGVDNAGEYIVAARDGGLGLFVDAQSLGPPGTGGNFGLMKLAAGG